jgi:RNA polymerase sigma-70 factor, ECF subfamily
VIAEDLGEDVFVRAWEALPRFKFGGNPFVTWLYSIARNAIIDYHRRDKNRPLSELALRRLTMTDASPEEQTALLSDVVVLSRALAKLTEEEQQVVILRFAENLAYQEIATIVGKSEGACRVIQHRALSALQAWLKHDLERD